MKKMVLFLTCAVTWASPVPTSTLNCSISNLPVSCGTDDGLALSRATFGYTLTGLDTADGLNIRLLTSASSGMYVPSLTPEMTSASASAQLSFFGSTAGPVRTGYAVYSMATSSDWFINGAANASVSVEGLAALNGPADRFVVGTLPFTLGTEFAVNLFSWSERLPGIGMVDGANSAAILTLRLFESDGTAVVISDPSPSSEVPEPATWMVGLPLILLVARSAKAPRRS